MSSNNRYPPSIGSVSGAQSYPSSISFSYPSPLLPTPDLSPDLHHWRSGIGGGRFTVDSGGGCGLGGLNTGEGAGKRGDGRGKGKLKGNETLHRDLAKAVEVQQNSKKDLGNLSPLSISNPNQRSASPKRLLSSSPSRSAAVVSSGALRNHQSTVNGQQSSVDRPKPEALSIKGDTAAASGDLGPVSISIPSAGSIDLAPHQNHLGALFEPFQVQQDSSQLSHSLPSHFDLWNSHHAQLDPSFASVPSSPAFGVPITSGLDFYQSQQLRSALDHQILSAGTSQTNNGRSSGFSDSGNETVRLNSNLSLSPEGVSHHPPTILIPSSQPESLLSSPPVNSLASPFPLYLNQSCSADSPTPPHPVRSHYYHPLEAASHRRHQISKSPEPELFASASLQPSSANHSSDTPGEHAPLDIDPLRTSSSSTPLSSQPVNGYHISGQSYSARQDGNSPESQPLAPRCDSSPVSPALSIISRGGLGRQERPSSGQTSHSQSHLSPTGPGSVNSWGPFALSSALKGKTSADEAGLIPSHISPKENAIFISTSGALNFSNQKLRSCSGDSSIKNNINGSPQSAATYSPFTPTSPTTPWSGLNSNFYSDHASSLQPPQLATSPSRDQTENRFKVELWKMYGPRGQTLPPDNNALESLIRKLREVGLDFDEFRQRWSSRSDIEKNSSGATAMGQDQDDLNAGSSIRSEEENRKNTFNSFSKSFCSQNFQSVVQNASDPIQRKSPCDEEAQNASPERGRKSRNLPFLTPDSNLKDHGPAVEMDWRAHSRSRSRPPETTKMDWRGASRSRSRAMERSLNIPEIEGFSSSCNSLSEASNLHLDASLGRAEFSGEGGCFYDPFHSSSHLLHQPHQPSFWPGMTPAGQGLMSIGENQQEDVIQQFISSYQSRNLAEMESKSSSNANNANSYAYTSLTGMVASDGRITNPSESQTGSSSSFSAAHSQPGTSASAGFMSDYDSIEFTMKPYFQNSMLGSIPGLNEDFAKLANAHAEYGSIPRVVRKTSFDETLAQQLQRSVAAGNLNSIGSTDSPSEFTNGSTQSGTGDLDRHDSLIDETRPSTANVTETCRGIQAKVLAEGRAHDSAGAYSLLTPSGPLIRSSMDQGNGGMVNSRNRINGLQMAPSGEEGPPNSQRNGLYLSQNGVSPHDFNSNIIKAENSNLAQFFSGRKKSASSSGGRSVNSQNSHHTVICGEITSCKENIEGDEQKENETFALSDKGEVFLQNERSNKFSGGRSVQLSSIGEARRRNKQLPYLSWETPPNSNSTSSNSTGDFSNADVSNSGNSGNSNGSGNQTQCLNCKTKETPLWRRDGDGKPLCNACGLFVNLHGIPRPAALSTGVIKRRNRVKNGDKEKSAQRSAQKAQAQQDKSSLSTLVPSTYKGKKEHPVNGSISYSGSGESNE